MITPIEIVTGQALVQVSLLGVEKLVSLLSGTADKSGGVVETHFGDIQRFFGTWLEIDTETDYVITDIVRKYLHSLGFCRSTIIVRSAGSEPSFSLPDGTYNVSIPFSRKETIRGRSYVERMIVNITVNSDKKRIYIKGPAFKNTEMMSFMVWMYKKFHTTSESAGYIFFSSSKGWTTPFPVRPIEISESILTPSMRRFLTHFTTNYLSLLDDNANPSIRKRSGYMLLGEPGTGKTTTIQILQKTLNMSIYMMNLNGNQMDDSSLAILIGSVPPRSLIVFEEIEKQWIAVNKNSTCNISTGGFIVSFDGPQRISRGSVVIMTSNDIQLLDETFRKQLLRKGRLEEPFLFEEVL